MIAAQGSAAPAPQPTLLALLAAEGRISPEQVQQALETQARTGGFIGEILVETGIIEETSLLSFLARQCKIPHLSLLDYLIDASLLDLIPSTVCLRHRVLPIDRLGRNLTVAMVDPLDTAALEEVRRICPDLRIKPILCAFKHFETVAARLFEQGPAGAPADLTASSLGLAPARPPKPEPATAPAPMPAPEPPPPPEPDPDPDELPFATEVVDDAPPVLSEDGILRGAFRKPPPAGAADPGAPPDLVRDMTAAMMNSLRDTYAVLARRMELFRGIPPEHVARIFAQGATVEFEAGQTIFEKGAPGDKMYAILIGNVDILDDGQTLARLDRGGMFGEMALWSQAPRSAAAIATTHTTLLALDRAAIHEVFPPEVALQLLTNIIVTLSARLRDANTRLHGQTG